MMALDGTLSETEGGGMIVRFERVIDRPVPKAWAALTDPAILKNWLGKVEIEPRVGGKFSLHFHDSDAKMDGTITTFEPERVLEFTWLENYGMPPSLCRWELSPAGTGCRLVLTHRFPPGCKRTDVIPFLGGWEAFVDVITEACDGGFVPYKDDKPMTAEYKKRYL